MGTQPPPRKGAYCKHIQVLHKDQYRSVQAKHSQEMLLLESVKSFFKQRFALEKQHFESLSKICSSQYRAFECLKKLPSNENNEVSRLPIYCMVIINLPNVFHNFKTLKVVEMLKLFEIGTLENIMVGKGLIENGIKTSLFKSYERSQLTLTDRLSRVTYGYPFPICQF